MALFVLPCSCQCLFTWQMSEARDKKGLRFLKYTCSIGKNPETITLKPEFTYSDVVEFC